MQPNARHSERTVQIDADGIAVDAALIADGLGLAPASIPDRMRTGEITAICERGVDADAGTYRLTFFRSQRRVRLVVDEAGVVRRRSAIDFGEPSGDGRSRDRTRP